MNKYSLLLCLLVGTGAALGLASCEQSNRGPAEAPPQALAPTAAAEPQAPQMQPRIEAKPPIGTTQPNASVDSKQPSTGLLPASDKVDLAVYRNGQRLVQIARSLAPITNGAVPTNHPKLETEGQ
jgi:hypothetical protein